MSRPRFLADQDFNENILRGVQRLEPTVEFLRLRDVGLDKSLDSEVLACCGGRAHLPSSSASSWIRNSIPWRDHDLYGPARRGVSIPGRHHAPFETPGIDN